ncbi:hypothetical protein SprV_0100119400 [Sparganum proliferum]
MFQILFQTVEKDASDDLFSDGEEGCSSIMVTELAVHFPLLELDDCGTFEILRNLSLAPHLLEERCEPPFHKAATTMEVCVVVFGWEVDAAFAKPVLIGEQVADGGAVVIKPVMILATCMVDDS